MAEPRLEEVFKLSGVPTHTFVEPTEYPKLLVALRTPGRGVIIEGPSGIGKTTAVVKALADLHLTTARRLTPRKREDREAIEQLSLTEPFGAVIVDDFHKLESKIQAQLSDMLKVLADEERADSKLVIVGINKVGDSLVALAPDLNTRIDVISFEANPSESVERLVTKGEQALKIELNTKRDIVATAAGSFFLAQLLSSETCLLAGVTEAQADIKPIETSLEAVKSRVMEQLDRTFDSKVRSCCLGVRQRTDGRAPYLFVLKWLSESNEWSINLEQEIRRHSEHRGSVGQVVEKGFLQQLFEKEPSLTEILHYNQKSQELTVEDPKFVFYLRNLAWSTLARKIGFASIEISTRYDFALSFAGADREIAKRLFELLSDEHELSVFYDKNEQHRILGADVEEYLKPIYSTEAAYVVPLLGPDYPKRIWTKFESEQFKERFNQGAVIPIWFKTAPTGLFDETTRVGGIEFDPAKDREAQLVEIADVLVKRLRE